MMVERLKQEGTVEDLCEDGEDYGRLWSPKL